MSSVHLWTENALTDTVSQCEGRMLNAPFKDAMSFQTQGSILARLQPPHWEPALVTVYLEMRPNQLSKRFTENKLFDIKV